MADESSDAKVTLRSQEGRQKVALNILFCGKVDGGKSVLTSRLLFGLGGLSDHKRTRIQNKADDTGKGNFAFAFWMDEIMADRERGTTIHFQQPTFFTNKWKYSLTTQVDAKTTREIEDAAHSNVAVLTASIDSLLRCSQGVFSFWEENVCGDGQDHARLLNIFDVKLLVCINKMDSDTASYSEEAFNMARDHMKTVLEGAGFDMDSVPIIPTSGWAGDNVLTKSEKMNWWDGVDVTAANGETKRITTLVDALEQLPAAPEAGFEEHWQVEARYAGAILKLLA